LKVITSFLLIFLSCSISAKILITKLEGTSFLFKINSKPILIKYKDKIHENDIITTSSNGLVLIDFNDEVVGSVIVGPNSKVILRKTKALAVRLLSVVEGQVRFFKTKSLMKKRSGVLINIRDKNTAYIGNNFEVNYTKNIKKVTSFDTHFKKIQLTQTLVMKQKKSKYRTRNTDLSDQELEEDLKFLIDN
jgi:hypothetical protein